MGADAAPPGTDIQVSVKDCFVQDGFHDSVGMELDMTVSHGMRHGTGAKM